MANIALNIDMWTVRKVRFLEPLRGQGTWCDDGLKVVIEGQIGGRLMALGASVGFEDLGLCQRVVLLNEPDEICSRSGPCDSKSVLFFDGRFGWLGGALQTLGSSEALLLACSDDIQKVVLVFVIEFMRKIQLVACFAVLAKLDRLVEYVRVGLTV